jgi:hypothetical protein
MKKLSETIEGSLVDSVRSDSLRDLVLDAGEVAIDSLVNDGVARDIPFFGMMVRGYQSVISIREGIFTRKLYKFLREISKSSKEMRENIMQEVADKKGGTVAAGTAILDLIDKLDADVKPELVGKLFNACADQLISVDDYLRLSDVISKIYLDDLRLLSDPHPSGLASVQQKNIFLANGLMSLGLRNPSRSGSGASMLQMASDIYEKPFELQYRLTRAAAQISLYCFGVDRFSDDGVERFVDS